MTERIFTIEEQIHCIMRQIGTYERMVEIFKDDDEAELQKAIAERDCLKCVLETLEFTQVIEHAAIASENNPWLEESQC